MSSLNDKQEEIVSAIFGKGMPPQGVAPAVALCNPQYGHNVGAIQRACSCFGIKQLWFSGDRVEFDLDGKTRLPREERMRGYEDVEVRQYDQFFDQFDKDVTPVAIELSNNAELLPQFDHPDNALYVFGPEDGNIPSVMLRHCHRFVVMPLHHCTNLAAAVYIVLYDRMFKRIQAGKEPLRTIEEMLKEDRAFTEPLKMYGKTEK